MGEGGEKEGDWLAHGERKLLLKWPLFLFLFFQFDCFFHSRS